MTDQEDNKPKKLTLSSNRLFLNKAPSKTLGVSSLVKTTNTSGRSTVIEVRKNQTLDDKAHDAVFSKKNNNNNASEIGTRLNVLIKAAEEAKDKEHNNLNVNKNINKLSDIAAMNQPISQNIKKEQLQEEVKVKPEEIAEVKHESKTIKVNILPISQINPKPLKPKEITKILINEATIENSEISKKVDKTVTIKNKIEENKKLNKNKILYLLDDNDTVANKTRSLASIKRAREKEKRKSGQLRPEKLYREVIIPESILVADLANRMSERVTDVIRELMKLGIIATANQLIDADTAEIIATTLGHSFKRVQESDIENILISETDKEYDLKPRAPIVTVMGHVDHGKTSLLDALKSTDVAAAEAGGITQHVGAYKVTLDNGESITFIDTPGHEAFTNIRSRGAEVTDIVVLVVAADDGIKTQTVEAINHAKAAGVPIIVAVNKIDKPDVNIERIQNELLQYELIAEELGGDTIIVPVSALKKLNLDKLEEAILLSAEMLELKANPNTVASGTIIEARLDKNTGPIATVLVQRGTLKNGDIIVAGTSYGRIRKMVNDKSSIINMLLPSEAAEVYGLNEAPRAGDKFNVVSNEKQARDIIEYRLRLAKDKKNIIVKRSTIEDLFSEASGTSNVKELAIVLKGDVQGSVEAIINSIIKLSNDEVKVKIMHSGVGAITESDISLAKATKSIVIGFNVRANPAAASALNKDKITLNYYSIIYDLVDDIKNIVKGMIAPIIREQFLGEVEIRQVFNVTKVGKIAGSYVTKGIIKRGAGVRLLRDNVVIHEGKLKTLKRFKEDVKEVRENFECGIAFENFSDMNVGDMIEVFEIITEKG